MFKRVLLVVLSAVVLLAAAAQAAEKKQGAYVKMVEAMKADIHQTADKVKAAIEAAGFTVLASYDNGVPEGCNFKAHTVVFTKPDYAEKVLAGGPDKGFGLPLRVGLYEDEKGLNIAVTNPVHLNRVFYLNNSMDAAAQEVLSDVASALKGIGPVVSVQIGQVRSEGEIRGIGGGKFPDKVVDVAGSAKSLDEMAAAIAKGMASPAGYHVVYTYRPSDKLVIVGVTNDAKMEGRAFQIAGEKRADSGHRFPGIDHAAAFPIEVLLYSKGGRNTAVIVDEMWRMKLYFEDAGMWAFMKNMGMPGEIQDEVEAGVKGSLK